MKTSMLSRARLLAALVLAVVLSFLSVAPASAVTVSARALLLRLTVASESGSTTYERTYFKHWVDANGDCQDTRQEVLVAESTVTPTYSSSRRCTVTKGRWYSYYDGKTWTNPSDVDIDHVVALKEA